MHLARLALLSVAAIVLAACAGGAAAPQWTYGPTAPPASGSPAASQPAATTAASTAAPSPTASPAPGASGSSTRIEVKLTDQLRIEPALLNVPAGVPVTFVVTNVGALDHEFFVGDERAQADHEAAMTGTTTAPPDQASGVGLKPGQTKELTITFAAPASLLAGCHIAGHYLAGMKATITVR